MVSLTLNYIYYGQLGGNKTSPYEVVIVNIADSEQLLIYRSRNRSVYLVFMATWHMFSSVLCLEINTRLAAKCSIMFKSCYVCSVLDWQHAVDL